MTTRRYREPREPISTRLLIIAVWLLANGLGIMMLVRPL
jgi:hypothetical protein